MAVVAVTLAERREYSTGILYGVLELILSVHSLLTSTRPITRKPQMVSPVAAERLSYIPG